MVKKTIEDDRSLFVIPYAILALIYVITMVALEIVKAVISVIGAGLFTASFTIVRAGKFAYVNGIEESWNELRKV